MDLTTRVLAWNEKAILGALGEFRGILGAALGIGNSILGIRNSILGMASHDLINTKPTILGATLGAIPGIAANPPERFSFAPAFSGRFFKNWGGPRAPELRSAPVVPDSGVCTVVVNASHARCWRQHFCTFLLGGLLRLLFGFLPWKPPTPPEPQRISRPRK